MDEETAAVRTPFMADVRDPQTASSAQAPSAPAAPGNMDEDLDEEESGYTVEQLSAVVRPVALTMILASLAVGEVREPTQDAAISSGLKYVRRLFLHNTYLVYNEGSGGGSQSGGEQFGQALINALVIVGVICVATFVLVLCYYFRCLKVMVAYLIFASVNLLGYSGGFMAYTAIQVWQITADWLSFVFIMYNFAIGGAVAVFWQKGVPRVVTQGYLVCVSVIMSWIVTKLPEWTSWTLLVILALYDLCAVLTPCGPLKALIALAQTRQDPIPGLLYEANVGGSGGGRGAAGGVRDTFVTQNGVGGQPPPVSSESPPRRTAQTGKPKNTAAVKSGKVGGANIINVASQSKAELHGVPASQTVSSTSPSSLAKGKVNTTRATNEATSPEHGVPTGAPPGEPRHGSRPTPQVRTEVGLVSESQIAAAAGVTQHPHTYHHPGHDADHTRRSRADIEAAEVEPEERSIKLGLGDFVFYSVLVSRAALFDVSTMAACFVSVIMGLGGTLFLLGVMKKALPALPISIFLGVAFYFLTRLVVVPMIVELSLNGAGL